MELAYPLALLRQSLAAAATSRARFALLAGTMFLNDAMFFLFWVIFFSGVKQVRGWTFADVAAFQSMVVIGFGVMAFFGRGAMQLGRRIAEGDIDTFLVRPRRALPQLVTLECDASALGDIAYGIALLLAVVHPGAAEALLALAIALLIAGLFLAVAVFVQSLAFFMRGGSALADQLFEMMLILGSIPQHTGGLAVRFVLFTIVPAGFMAILPVEIARHGNPALLAVLAAAVGFYLAVAVAFFHAGLRRYTSATGWRA